MKRSNTKQTYRFDSNTTTPTGPFLLRRSCRIALTEDWQFELPLSSNASATLRALGQDALADNHHKITGYYDAGRFFGADATGKLQTLPVTIPAGTELLVNRVSARYGIPSIVFNCDLVKVVAGPKGRAKKQKTRVSINVTDVECATMKYKMVSSPDFVTHIERRNAHVNKLPTIGALYTFVTNLRCNVVNTTELHELAASVDYEHWPSKTKWRTEVEVLAGSHMTLLATWSAKFNGLERNMYAFLLEDGTMASMMLLGPPSRFMRLVDKEITL